MMLSDSVLVVLLVVLAVLLILIPVLLVRVLRAVRKQPQPAPPPASQAAVKPADAKPRMQFPPEEREGQTGGALMQDYSALNSEYRPVDAQKDALPTPRKNGKH